MRNNETGEFEWVVGNRQLLSGFFIMVLLFAVAFAMGYVVGENSKTAKPTEVASAQPPSPTPGDRPMPSTAPAAAAPAPAPTPAETRPTAAEPPQPTTQPSRDVPPVQEIPTPPRHETPVKKVEKAEAAPPPRETRTSPPAPAPTVQPTTAPPGSYWQVLATANHDSAQDMVKTLQDKGLPASLSPGPNNLLRVVVGPYRDTDALSKAKTELESAGLHPVRR